MTFEEKYTKLSKKLFDADITKFGEDFAIQITMDDEDCGGTFFAAFSEGAYRVEPYDYVDNTASVNVKADVLSKLIDKKLTVESALYEGLLSVNGNSNHVAMLFDAIVKKTAAKKPAAKKATAKKEPVKKEATVKKTAEKKKTTKKSDK